MGSFINKQSNIGNSTHIFNKVYTTKLNDGENEVSIADLASGSTVEAALNLKADKATTYTKTEVDSALGAKADASTTYTKTEVDTALGDKADVNNVYTKTEVDTALGAKADASTTYTKTEVDTALGDKADADDVYTKTEVDAKLVAAMRFKGSVANVDALPDDADVGDVYNVEDTGANYAWDGEDWDKLSENIDLSGVYTKTEVDNALGLKAPLASPTLTGTPTAPTAETTDDSTKIATTAFVKAQGYATESSVTTALSTKANSTQICWEYDEDGNLVPM